MGTRRWKEYKKSKKKKKREGLVSSWMLEMLVVY